MIQSETRLLFGPGQLERKKKAVQGGGAAPHHYCVSLYIPLVVVVRMATVSMVGAGIWSAGVMHGH